MTKKSKLLFEEIKEKYLIEKKNYIKKKVLYWTC